MGIPVDPESPRDQDTRGERKKLGRRGKRRSNPSKSRLLDGAEGVRAHLVKIKTMEAKAMDI